MSVHEPDSAQTASASRLSRWLIAGAFFATLVLFACSVYTDPVSSGLSHSDVASANALLHAEPSKFFQMAEPGLTAADVLDRLEDYSSFIILTTGTEQPTRREANQPFFSIDSSSTLPQRAVDAINKGVGVAETALGRLLYPVVLRIKDLKRAQHWFQPTGHQPYAVFDFSTGELVVDSSIASSWQSERVLYLLEALSNNIFKGLEKAGDLAAASSAGGAAVVSLLLMSSAMALYAAFAAAPPLWFCLACPTVLGLLAPLVINFGLGDLATLVCQRMQLTDEACYDLLLGALGVGFVLSLASAVPIFLVCRLAECAHRNGSALLTLLPRHLKLM